MPRTSRSAAWRGPRRSPPRCCFWPLRPAASSPAANCWSTAACALSEPVRAIVFRSAQTARRAALPTGQSGRSHLVRRISMPKLQGKVALVTGGSSGIGLATAKRFVEEGAFVYITGRRQTELDKAVSVIGRSIAAMRGDVSNLADLDRLYAKIASEKGKIDILFAGAGIVDPHTAIADGYRKARAPLRAKAALLASPLSIKSASIFRAREAGTRAFKMRFSRPGTILERFLTRPLRASDTHCSTLIGFIGMVFASRPNFSSTAVFVNPAASTVT